MKKKFDPLTESSAKHMNTFLNTLAKIPNNDILQKISIDNDDFQIYIYKSAWNNTFDDCQSGHIYGFSIKNLHNVKLPC